jgi:DNA helicase-2/ATP-dependent DNA helicase PcrA
MIATAKHVEDFLAPAVESPFAGVSAASEAALEALSEPERVEIQNEMAEFRRLVRRWHGATLLPIDQLVLSIAQEVFTEAADLAVAHKLALVLRQLADENPQWRLPDLTPHLKDIARNERRFIGFSADDAGFNPDAYKGTVVVATIHKAKGLEWDRVYLLSINSYDFPSAQTDDQFISEKWFVRDGLNLEAEALAQLKAAALTAGADRYEELKATQRSRIDYARERLRLLYVGITRARRELILSWNTGRRGDARPAVPLAALQGWWEQAGHQGVGPADQP